MKTLVSFVFVLGFAIAVSAQAVIGGRVTDEQGSVVPGAQVQFTRDNGKSFSTSTNDIGEYRIALETGVYRVVVSLPPLTEAVITKYSIPPHGSAQLDGVLKCVGCERTECPLFEAILVEMVPMSMNDSLKVSSRPLEPLLPGQEKPKNQNKPKKSKKPGT